MRMYSRGGIVQQCSDLTRPKPTAPPTPTVIQSVHTYMYFFSFSDIDTPTNMVTTDITEDTITVSWDRVQAEIEGYMLSYTSTEGSSAEIPVGRDSTSYRLVGLQPGVLHNIYLWAFNEDKVSRRSSTQAETGKLYKRESVQLGRNGIFK